MPPALGQRPRNVEWVAIHDHPKGGLTFASKVMAVKKPLSPTQAPKSVRKKDSMDADKSASLRYRTRHGAHAYSRENQRSIPRRALSPTAAGGHYAPY